MKKIQFILLLVVITNFSVAQNKKPTTPITLSGKITDAKNGSILTGATIYIHDIKLGAISNSNGNYTLNNINIGNYIVEVSMLGYATIIEKIIINNNTIKNFTLIAAIANHDAVIVTGTTSATNLKQTAQPINIVKKTDLLQTTATNIIDALSKRVPGLNNLSTGPAISKPIIRGLGYNRIVVLNDGIKQEGQQWGDEHGIEIDDNSVQKAEIIKGPASLMYGSDAIAGVVHIITNSPIEQNAIRGNIGYQFLNNNALQNISGNIAGHLNNGFNWNWYGTYKSAKDYQNKYDGNVFNSRYNEKNIGGYIGINKKWGYSHLIVSNFAQQVGLVEGERDAVTGNFLIYGETPDEREANTNELNSRYIYTPYQTINHFKIATDNNFNLRHGRITTNIAYQRNKRLEYGDYLNNTTPNLFFNLQTITYNLQYHAKENNGWMTSFGMNGMLQENKNQAEEVLIPEYNQFDMGAFMYTKKTFKKLTVSSGIRLDTRNINTKAYNEGMDIKFTPLNKNYANFSASAGIAYAASNKITLKLNAARGFRAPTVAELTSNGQHEGTNRYEYGNNNLNSETSLQLDAGIEIFTEHVTFGINAFNNNINNYIFYNKLESVNGSDSIVVTPNGDATAFKFAQSNAVLNGFELKFDIHPHPLDWLHFENSVSLVVGTFNRAIDGSKNLPFMPAPKWLSELRADINKIGSFFNNAYIKFESDKVFTQNKIFDAYHTETITNGYQLFNCGLGTDIVVHNKKIMSLHFACNNITDVAYQNHLSRLKYTAENNVTGRQGVFNMGRNYSIKLQIPIHYTLIQNR